LGTQNRAPARPERLKKTFKKINFWSSFLHDFYGLLSANKGAEIHQKQLKIDAKKRAQLGPLATSYFHRNFMPKRTPPNDKNIGLTLGNVIFSRVSAFLTYDEIFSEWIPQRYVAVPGAPWRFLALPWRFSGVP